MTKDNLYYLGKLGKPHGLLGFQYINIDKYFRDLDLSNVNILIGQKEYKIDNFKKHLKDRNLIKFENIDSVDESESLRNNEVFISSKYKYLINKKMLKLIIFMHFLSAGFLKLNSIGFNGCVPSAFAYFRLC